MLREKPPCCQGYTLIELMVTIAVAAILMSMAVPSFNATIRSNRLTTSANDWVSTLNFARSEAIKRSAPVSVRRKGTTSQQWDAGWDVFVDLNGNGAFDDNGNTTLCEATEDCLLKTYYALPAGYTLRTGNSSYRDYATYLAGGLSKNQVSEVFRLCDNTQDTSNSRTISVNAVGRPSTAAGSAASCP
ncbi:MAG: GspH/FimT family pseudopilin [Methylomonas sp.]